MKNVKLFELLSTFSNSELKEIRSLTGISFFNRGRDVSRFFEILCKEYPSFRGEEFNKKQIFEILYPRQKYRDHIIRNLLSALTRVIEDYLVIKNLRKDKVEFRRNLLQNLIDRRVRGFIQSNFKEMERLLSDKSKDVENYYMNKRFIEYLSIMNFIKTDQQHKSTNSIFRIGELITYEFLENASISVGNYLTVRENYNVEYYGNIFETFLSCIDLKDFLNRIGNIKNKNEKTEIAEIYTCIIITLTQSDDEEYLLKLKELILKNLKHFGRTEKYNLLVTLGNCISLKATIISREKYLPELFEIYRLRFESGLYSYSDNQPMSSIFFYSILKLAITLNEFSWAKTFIEKAVLLLSEGSREDMKYFGSAEIYFAMKKFDYALQSLSKVRVSNIGFIYEVRALQIQIYYELEDYDTAYYAIDAYNHFINSNKTVSEYFRYSSERFLSLIRKLLKYKLNKDTYIPQKFINEITSSNIAQKDWFLEKVKAIEFYVNN